MNTNREKTDALLAVCREIGRYANAIEEQVPELTKREQPYISMIFVELAKKLDRAACLLAEKSD